MPDTTDKEQASNTPPPRKRGRPKGAKDKGPRRPYRSLRYEAFLRATGRAE